MTWRPLAVALTLTALVAPVAAHAAPEPRAYPERDAHQLDRIAGHARGGLEQPPVRGVLPVIEDRPLALALALGPAQRGVRLP